MEKKVLYQLLMKMHSVFSFYKPYISKVYMTNRHRLRSWCEYLIFHIPIAQTNSCHQCSVGYPGVHEHSPSAVNSPLVIWKTLPKACKTRTIPTNTSSVLERAISDIHRDRFPRFLLLSRRQRKWAFRAPSRTPVSRPLLKLLPHRTYDARARAPVIWDSWP